MSDSVLVEQVADLLITFLLQGHDFFYTQQDTFFFYEDSSSTAAQRIYTPDRMTFINQFTKCNVSFRIRPPPPSLPPPLIKSSRFFFQSRGTKRYVIDESTNNRLDGVNIIFIIIIIIYKQYKDYTGLLTLKKADVWSSVRPEVEAKLQAGTKEEEFLATFGRRNSARPHPQQHSWLRLHRIQTFDRGTLSSAPTEVSLHQWLSTGGGVWGPKFYYTALKFVPQK